MRIIASFLFILAACGSSTTSTTDADSGISQGPVPCGGGTCASPQWCQLPSSGGMDAGAKEGGAVDAGAPGTCVTLPPGCAPSVDPLKRGQACCGSSGASADMSSVDRTLRCGLP